MTLAGTILPRPLAVGKPLVKMISFAAQHVGMRLRKVVDDYMALEYPMNLVADEQGGYTVIFPDLPGCMTQVESVDELPEMATDARRLWIETELEAGNTIPAPSYPSEYSGKFVLRVTKMLHRSLAESAHVEGVSLNQYVSTLLARGDAQARIERKLDALTERVDSLDARMRYEGAGISPQARRAVGRA